MGNLWYPNKAVSAVVTVPVRGSNPPDSIEYVSSLQEFLKVKKLLKKVLDKQEKIL